MQCRKIHILLTVTPKDNHSSIHISDRYINIMTIDTRTKIQRGTFLKF